MVQRGSPLQGVSPDDANVICSIIDAVSFNSELGGAAPPDGYIPETGAVQDADRLEAIGAIGIARCLMYGGAKKRPLYGPRDLDAVECARIRDAKLTKEEYALYSETTVGHFYAKLLKLKDMMKTAAGRACAQQRHDFMLTFLDQLCAEINGER